MTTAKYVCVSLLKDHLPLAAPFSDPLNQNVVTCFKRLSVLSNWFCVSTWVINLVRDPPVRRDNPRVLSSGLSTVQADETCSISLVA